MGDLTVVSEKKYKHLRLATIIMPIVAVALLAVLGYMLYGITQIMGYKLAPTEGVWYCEELDAEVDFDNEPENIMTDADGVQYLFSSHSKSHTVEVYTIAAIVPIRQGVKEIYQYEPGQLVYQFTYVSLKRGKYTVQDEAGNKYVFVRK